jgi:hypothetical protein
VTKLRCPERPRRRQTLSNGDFAAGGISNEPESLARPQRGYDTVTILKRARAIPHEFHDWELSSEAQLV